VAINVIVRSRAVSILKLPMNPRGFISNVLKRGKKTALIAIESSQSFTCLSATPTKNDGARKVMATDITNGKNTG
jgi:hypothetical protein